MRTVVSARCNKVPSLTPVRCSFSLYSGGCGELTSMPPYPHTVTLTDVATVVLVCIHKGFLLCSVCIMYRLWVYVEHRFLRKQALRGSKGRGMWHRGEGTVYPVVSLFLSVLCCEWSTWVTGVSTVLARNLYTYAHSLTKVNEGKTRPHESCNTLTYL